MALAGEFDIIARYFAPLAAGHAGAFGLSDDAAVVRPAEGCEIVVTNDALVEGVHYLGGDPPGDIARKALRVNLSDLAAMGAVPRFYNLALALSPAVDEDWLAGFAAGLGEDQGRYGLCLIGGDTVSTPGPVMIAITAMGEVPAGRALRRGGARDGDRIFVSGTIGDAGAGLGILAGKIAVGDADRARLVERYRVPSPRTALGPALVGLAHAAIDVSDGLLADLAHICEVSGRGATIEAAAMPVSETVGRCTGYGLADALSAGDDYELLFTVPRDRADEVHALADRVGVPVAEIGGIEPERGVRLVGKDGDLVEIERTGFRHF